ncbi:TonB-dependent receptor [Panacibacter ginsenosidivorans]|uniref:TonB-dependent receptor n=1 Tax=Panacibacter ginsenosidivorans TaxID=1813871 RepID=A0A5B8VB37_9BACT|nr:TonB-dependent receptor [Panacibacter ginsenosidivorans]QEC68469.1 TonB-dependent receptor [Panacibacter ginsenosidivorans]
MRQKIDCLAVRLCAAVFFMFIAATAFAQKTVTGTVTSAKDNQPINGASILVKGTNVGTATSPTGTFSINVPAGKKILVISSVGFDDQEIDVSSQSTISVALKEKTSSLDEIVVTGYTAQKKKEITGAVAVVNVKDMKQVPVGTGEEALQGRASGLTVISSGQPGAASDLRIRGVTTFGNNQPLVMVDGVRGDLHNINVSDIESIQVLKDASAAIYGVAGANGVIIVTTKKGKAGKARVSYDGYYGVTTKGPGFDMANTQEEANAIWQQRINSGLQPGDEGWGSKQYGTGVNPVIPDYITPTGAFEGDPNTDPATYNINSNQITRANKAGTDWYDVITRNAPTQSHNISVSSGSDKSSYFFSFGYLNQQGIARFQYNKRYSVRANTQFNIGNKIRVGENAYVFYKNNPTYGNQGEGSPFSVAFREDAIIPVYDIAGNFAGTKSQDLGNAQNPYANIYRSKDNKSNNWDITGNVYAEVDFLKHFTARTSFGGVVDNNYYYYFSYVGYENAEGNTGANSFTEGAGYNSSWTYTNTLTYGNTFGNHNVKVLVGTEAVNYYGRNLSGTRSNYFSENPNYWVLGAGTGTQSNAGGAYQSSLWSQFAKLEYGYAGKYLLNASIRRDGASVFAEDVRYGYFPGVSAAWRISQENFMKGVSFINDLKLRGSWGKMGTAGNVGATNPFNLYSTRLGRSAYDISGTSTSPYAGFFRSNVGNPSTTWEGDIITNIGVDATILKNKIDFTVEWYKKKVNDLLYGAQGPQWASLYVGDAGLPQVNIADNQNSGLDLSLTYHANVSKDFKLDVTGIFTSYKNKIVSIPGSGYFDAGGIRNVVIQRNEVGHPLGAFFGYDVIGLFQSQDDIDKSPSQPGAAPGLFKYRDVNNDGTIDANDRTYIGSPHPDFTYGLNLAMSYKSFDFSAFFFGSKGNDIYNQTLYYTDFPDFFKGGIRREAAVNSWTPENTNTSIPALYNTGSFSSDQSTSSYFISKGSYFRCKQMQLGYTLPGTLLSRFGIEHLRIYVQSANLFTITKYNGLDPELTSTDPSSANANNLGIDQGNYPHTPSYLVGINLNF